MTTSSPQIEFKEIEFDYLYHGENPGASRTRVLLSGMRVHAVVHVAAGKTLPLRFIVDPEDRWELIALLERITLRELEDFVDSFNAMSVRSKE